MEFNKDQLPPLMAHLGSEMQLLICCARIEMVNPFQNHMTQLIDSGLDWGTLLPMAKRHGMVALLHKHLTILNEKELDCIVPQVFIGKLHKETKSQAIRQLFLTSRMVKISRILAENDIPHLHYKGIILDHLLYGGQMLRPTSDMDILVKKEDVLSIKKLLFDQGYHSLHMSGEDEIAEQIWLKYKKDYAFIHPRNNHMIEVHWQLTTSEISTEIGWSYLQPVYQSVELNGQWLQTLSREDTYLTLCTHGARHRFERLRWICDLSQFILLNPDIDWSIIMNRSETAGVKRMVLLGSHLATNLLGANLLLDIGPSYLSGMTTPSQLIEHLSIDTCHTLSTELDSSAKATRYGFEIRLLDSWQQRVSYLVYIVRKLSSRDVHQHDEHPILGPYHYVRRAFQIIQRRGLGTLLTTLGQMIRSLR
ncbi:MAG: nucleotidyltransferase family protein [Chloroflexota bacterium]